MHTPTTAIMRDRLDHGRSVFLLAALSEATTARAEGEFGLQDTIPLALKNVH